MTQNVTDLTDATFAETVRASKEPVLVDFWAPWCGPCRAVAPILESLAVEYAGRIRIAKVNVDDNPRTAASFRVSAIPTMILFKKGDPVEQVAGIQPRDFLRSLFDRHLA